MEYHDELVADFRQYYNLPYDRIGEVFSYEEAAILAAQLPQTSRVMRAIDPDVAYTEETTLLRNIEYALRVLVWQNTRNGKSGIDKPEPVKMPSERREKSDEEKQKDRSLVDKVLKMRR